MFPLNLLITYLFISLLKKKAWPAPVFYAQIHGPENLQMCHSHKNLKSNTTEQLNTVFITDSVSLLLSFIHFTSSLPRTIEF